MITRVDIVLPLPHQMQVGAHTLRGREQKQMLVKSSPDSNLTLESAIPEVQFLLFATHNLLILEK
jgi:hypothetical protein